ncbi:MAG: WYL domain-containing protein [Muricomes sp.]
MVFQLLDAIRKTSTIVFSYINSQGIESEKYCEPYRVVYKDRSWYLDAYDTQKSRFSVYKIARISGIVLQDSFEKREFNPTPYDGGEWINKDKVMVTIHVNKVVIDRFIEILGTDSIKSISSDIYEVSYPLHDNEWGYNVLLGYGKYIKVISPKSFIDNFVQYISSIREKYQC